LLSDEKQTALRYKVRDVAQEIENLNRMLSLQQQKVSYAETEVTRYQKLATDQYISKEQLDLKSEDLIEQQQKLNDLQTEIIRQDGQLNDARADLNTLGVETRSRIAELHRNVDSTDEQLAESEAKRRVTLTSPISGTTTTILAIQGQRVRNDETLMDIVPKGAQLHAELYVPSRAIGFVHVGDRVSLRFHAYPYQKFGRLFGTIQSVSKATLATAHFDDASSHGPTVSGADQKYLVIVTLASQEIRASGRNYKLVTGMALDADLFQERRRLYEWLFDPFYTFSRK